jgi:hypothetical protein
MEKFTTGLLLGMVGGALLVTNSYKMRVLVKKGQDEVMDRIDKIVDEKIKEMDEKPEEKKKSKKE